MAKYVVGARDLQRRLEKLPRLTQGVIVRRALRAAAKRVMEAEKAATPVVTGVMKGQLRVRAMKRSRVRIGYTARSVVKPGQRYYASFVNYGANGRPERRFWDKAVDSVAGSVLDDVVDALRRELAKLGV